MEKGNYDGADYELLSGNSHLASRWRHQLGAGHALFDQLELADVEFMLDKLIGKGFNTRRRMDGGLGAYNWYGKVSESSEAVHSLVFPVARGALRS